MAKLCDMLPADAGDTAEGRTPTDSATVRSVLIGLDGGGTASDGSTERGVARTHRACAGQRSTPAHAPAPTSAAI